MTLPWPAGAEAVGGPYKVKNNIMQKFYSEPVDALDLRLTKAEATLNSLEADPLRNIKVEEDWEPWGPVDSPVDYSEVQVAVPSSPPRASLPALVQIQRVTLSRADSPQRSRWGGSPSLPAHRASVIEGSREGCHQTSSNLRIFPHQPPCYNNNNQKDHIEHRISMAENTLGDMGDNPLGEGPCSPYRQTYSPYGAITNPYSPPTPSSPSYSPLPSSYNPRPFSYSPPPLIYSPPPPTYNPIDNCYLPMFQQISSSSSNTAVDRSSVIVRQQQQQRNPYPDARGWRQEANRHRLKEESDGWGVKVREGFGTKVKDEWGMKVRDRWGGKVSEEDNRVPEDIKVDPDWLNNINRLRTGFAYHMLEARRQQGGGSLHYPNMQLLDRLSQHDRLSQLSKLSQLSQHDTKPGNYPGYRPQTQGALAMVSSFLQGCPTVTSPDPVSSSSSPQKTGEVIRGKRGRPRKHAPKIPLPPLYVFIRNLLHSTAYNPSTVAWVDEAQGCFKVTSTSEFARTWGRMKVNRSEEMNYEKMSRAMRYHYGSEKQGRKGHLAMVKEKRLFYRFGELAVNWRVSEMAGLRGSQCAVHALCRNNLCLWTKE